DKYNSFPTSIEVATNMISISNNATKFAACKFCCKLYNIKDISTKKAGQNLKILRCIHVELPNYINISRRVSFNAILSKKVKVKDSIVRKPISIYPVINL
ncbi:11010_t:CDS:1, partial [Racocetra persica]